MIIIYDFFGGGVYFPFSASDLFNVIMFSFGHTGTKVYK